MPDSLLRRFGRKAVTGATIVLLSTTASCGSVIAGSNEEFCQMISMSEEHERLLVFTRFEREGVTFTEDYQYYEHLLGPVETNLDGFDEMTGIGYEYFSYEDCIESADRMDEAEWDRLHLHRGEVIALDYAMDHGGDAIRMFQTEWDDSVSHWRQLAEQVEEFIDWLRENGKL